MECTQQVACYPDPKCSFLVFWDTPGCGTLKHNRLTYFSDKHLYAFDCLIVVTASRISLDDVSLCSLAAKYRMPAVIVRTQSDADLDSLARRHKGMSGADLAAMLRAETQADFEGASSSSEAIYLTCHSEYASKLCSVCALCLFCLAQEVAFAKHIATLSLQHYHLLSMLLLSAD